jgi:signal transduction histidine kinase
VGFAIIQLLGLLIHTFNQINLQRMAEAQDFATRAAVIYRHVALAPSTSRAMLAATQPVPDGDTVSLTLEPPTAGTLEMPVPLRDTIRGALFSVDIPPLFRPRGLILRISGLPLRYMISFGLPDRTFYPLPPIPVIGARPDMWLTVTTQLPPPEPWRSPGFATAFIVMTILGAIMIIWAVRTLLAPVKTLAEAAEALGRDVTNAKPLPETGPIEIVTAAIAFNTMASRVKRFVNDRTFLLTAIGHDLRTPITRLKLRAEYMEDDEQRTKMLADLDEMEAMVAATLAFGRDATSKESVARIDLASLLRTILDEAADGHPDHADDLRYEGPEHLAIRARPLALKRALVNIVGNALKYGDAARVTLHLPVKGMVRIEITDIGPGIPVEEMQRVFEPFQRLETSRNRETGGSGLGLSIARNILRAHGGDIALNNLPEGGLGVSVTLPV